MTIRPRRPRRDLAGILIAVVVLLFIGAILLSLTACNEAPGAGQTSTVNASEVALVTRDGGLFAPEPDRLLLARVDRVIDGDTLDVVVDGDTHRVRLFGVDAEERGERCYGAATEALATLAGSEVRLLADERREDEFGRWLRYAFTPDGRSIDAALLASGNARAWRDDGAFRDVLVRLEEDARRADEGCLWQ